ncbi:MAG: class I SAM-dependent methyltransferase [Polyangiaceae bacterium]|nr:class I SAM-dependent methyltransferase [Polyangiaceae bacterium]
MLQANGWLETQDIIRGGITAGVALEAGAGPGYLGLEWLKATHGTRLTGLDVSPDMVMIADRNARSWTMTDRAQYLCASADATPFEDGVFDAVFSSRSLHEWIDPRATFIELWRILKNGGRLLLFDLRRDLSRAARNFLLRRMTSDVVRDGLLASIDAAYTVGEAAALLEGTGFGAREVVQTPLGLRVSGIKQE